MKKHLSTSLLPFIDFRRVAAKLTNRALARAGAKKTNDSRTGAKRSHTGVCRIQLSNVRSDPGVVNENTQSDGNPRGRSEHASSPPALVKLLPLRHEPTQEAAARALKNLAFDAAAAAQVAQAGGMQPLVRLLQSGSP